MKAIILKEFGDVDNLQFLEVNKPQISSSEILVRVEACGVCSHDLINRKGFFPKTKLPMVLGHEMAGVVELIGDGVTNFKIGDRVINFPVIACGKCKMCVSGNEMLCVHRKLYGEDQYGGYAEYVKGYENSWVKLPETIGPSEGAIIPCTIGTALHAIRQAKLIAGEKVLITGATGGVGIHAVQLAKLFGAFVIATTTSDEKVSFIKDNGADEVIVLGDKNDVKKIKEMTNNEGVDIVLEIVGSPTFNLSIRSLAKGGRLIFVGNVESIPIEISPAIIILKELKISGSTGCTKEELEEAIELVRKRQVKPLVQLELPLSKAQEAHRALEDRKANGRIVLTP